MIYFIAGSNEQSLARSLSKALKGKLLNRKIICFSEGEIKIDIENKSLRNQTVYIVQSVTGHINDRLIELFLLADALKTLGCANIIAIIPYFGYSRQDESHSFRCILNLIRQSGIKKVITVDIHNFKSIEGLGIPVINLAATPLFIDLVKDRKNAMVIAPDKGAKYRAKVLAEALGTDFIVLTKERLGANNVRLLDIKPAAAIKGKDCYLIDDIIDGGSTICLAASKLTKYLPKSITAFISHGLFKNGALQSTQKSCIQKIYYSDSVKHVGQVSPKLKALRISPIIANYLKNDKR